MVWSGEVKVVVLHRVVVVVILYNGGNGRNYSGIVGSGNTGGIKIVILISY